MRNSLWYAVICAVLVPCFTFSKDQPFPTAWPDYAVAGVCLVLSVCFAIRGLRKA